MTAAMWHLGRPPASASGPPSSLVSSSTFDKGAEGPGRRRRASPPPRARPAATPRGLLSVGRAVCRRTGGGGGAQRPRMAAEILLATGYAVQTPPRAAGLWPIAAAPGVRPRRDGAPRGRPVSDMGTVELSGQTPTRAVTKDIHLVILLSRLCP